MTTSDNIAYVRSAPPAGRADPGPAGRQALIVSERPLFARALQAWSATGPAASQSQILGGSDLARPLSPVDPEQDGPAYLVGWEDLYGQSDSDYNDCMFRVEGAYLYAP